MDNLVSEVLLHLNEVEGQFQVLRQQQRTQADVCKKNYHEVMKQKCDNIEKDCAQVKQATESEIQTLGLTVVDCLKRGDLQLKSRLHVKPLVTSTPGISGPSSVSTTFLPAGSQAIGSC